MVSRASHNRQSSVGETAQGLMKGIDL